MNFRVRKIEGARAMPMSGVFLWAAMVVAVETVPVFAEWSEQQKLTASDGAPDDRFGNSVHLCGDTALVGAFYDDDDGTNSGSAYVFVRAGGVWTLQQKLTAEDAGAGAKFGYVVSCDGDTAIIGAIGGTGVPTGAAYVFVRSLGVWTQQRKLTETGVGAEYAYSVSVSGDTAVVGAFRDLNTSGSAFVYVRSGTEWTLQEKLRASDPAAGDQFGGSVCVNADTIVAGAGSKDCAAGVNCGSAYVFVRSGVNWTQQQKLTASDAAVDDIFGASVSVGGDTAVVGAIFDDCPAGPNCGSAYVFVRSGAVWTEQQKLTASDAAADDQFGHSVSVSGQTAAVGAPLGACTADSNCGSAYVYVRAGTVWAQQHKLTASDGAANDRFGNGQQGISVNDNTLVVGAYLDDNAGGVDAGSAYIFTLDCNDNGVSDSTDIANCDGSAWCSDCQPNGIPDGCDVVAPPGPNGLAWEQVSPAVAPSPRRNFFMAFDASRGVVVLFGGLLRDAQGDHYLGDTWEYDGSNWQLRNAGDPSGISAPAGRHLGAMVYDSGRQRCVLYGGNNAGTAFAETWEWDGQTWTLINNNSPPLSRVSHAMSYDEQRGVTVLFGGNTIMGRMGDTWEFDGTTWTQRSPGGPGEPVRREVPALAYDPVRQVTVLYGGNGVGPDHRDDTWEWNGTYWLEVNNAPGAARPSRHPGHAVAYHAGAGGVLMFGGGYAGPQPEEETWLWNGSAWTLLSAGGPDDPAPRYFHGLAFDSARGAAVLFGGVTGSYEDPASHNGETWEFGAHAYSADCDGNGEPDECQPDCDTDGTPDACEIPPIGSGVDCNGNGVPDECDGYLCNDGNPCTDDACNGTTCVFTNNTSPCDDGVACNGVDTCNGQGICVSTPVVDCNGNDIEDSCDLSNCDGSAWCDDCNENGVPDACDVPPLNSSAGQVWDATRDFSPTTNPNGPWTYGYSTSLFGPVTPFDCAATSAEGLDAWSRCSPSHPSIWHNGTNADIVPNGDTCMTIAPGVLILHPGESEERAVLRWICPQGGSYYISANLRGNSCGCGGVGSTVGVHIAIDSAEVASGAVMGFGDTFSYVTTRILAASSTVDVLINEGINNLVCDHIATNLVIQRLSSDCNGNGVPDECDGYLCNDDNPCTDDACDGTTCVYTNNTASCDDGNACTTDDTCSAGSCVGGPAPNCNDNNVCTDDSCDAVLGCQNDFNTVACDDAYDCTTADLCSEGVCAGSPMVVLYADVAPQGGNGVIDVDDILYVLDGFVDPPSYPVADIEPCEGDGDVDVDDILAALEAFVGNYLCQHPCPP